MADWHLSGEDAVKKAKELIAGDSSTRGRYGKKHLLDSMIVLLYGEKSLDSEHPVLGYTAGLSQYEVTQIEKRARQIVQAWRVAEGDLGLGLAENLLGLERTGKNPPAPDIPAAEAVIGEDEQLGNSDATTDNEDSSNGEFLSGESEPKWRCVDEEIPLEVLAESEPDSEWSRTIEELVRQLMPLHLILEPAQVGSERGGGSHGTWHVRGGAKWSTLSRMASEGIADEFLSALHDRLTESIKPFMRQIAEAAPCIGCTRGYAGTADLATAHFGFPCPNRPDDIGVALEYAQLVTHESDGLFVGRADEETGRRHRIQASGPHGYDIGVIIRRNVIGVPYSVVHVVGVGDVWPKQRREVVREVAIKVRLLAADQVEAQRANDDIPF